MSHPRHTASTITDDALDALYAEIDRLTAELADYDERVEAALREVLAVAEVIEANGIKWAADSIRRAAGTKEGSAP